MVHRLQNAGLRLVALGDDLRCNAISETAAARRRGRKSRGRKAASNIYLVECFYIALVLLQPYKTYLNFGNSERM